MNDTEEEKVILTFQDQFLFNTYVAFNQYKSSIAIKSYKTQNVLNSGLNDGAGHICSIQLCTIELIFSV